MIKTKFCFFQVQIKRVFGHAVKLCQSSFRITPKRLNPINMPIPTGKLILAMIDSKVLIKANIYQTIITTPAIGVDYRNGVHMLSNNALQCRLRAICHYFRIGFALSFQQPKHNRFTVSTTTTFATYSMRTKIRLVNLYCTLQRRFKLSAFCCATTDLKIDCSHGMNRNSNQFSRISGRKIQCKTSHKLPEFSFADSRTKIISIFNYHLSKLPHFKMCLTSLDPI